MVLNLMMNLTNILLMMSMLCGDKSVRQDKLFLKLATCLTAWTDFNDDNVDDCQCSSFNHYLMSLVSGPC